MASTSAIQKTRGWFADNFSWPLIKKLLTYAFFLVVAYLLVKQAATIEWAKVFETFKETEPSTLLLGFGIGFVCYLFYGSYDLLGRYLTRVKTGFFQNWFIAWLCYAFNLNLGAMVGGIAFRYRLYSRIGVNTADATRIIGLTILTNWLGYILLAGVLFMSGQIEPPEKWVVNTLGLQLLGAVFVLAVGVYLWACAFSRRRQYSLKNFKVTLPRLRLALLQLLLSSAHWTLMALTIYQFMPESIGFVSVFAVLLVSAVAGAVTHIPGGLGVLEAVFVMLLAGEVGKPAIIAALFAYRCVFYLAPLAVAVAAYLIFEFFFAKKR